MLDIKQLKIFLEKEIKEYYSRLDLISKQQIIPTPKRLIGSVLHEYILGLLFEKARDLDFFPIPEFYAL